MNYIIEDERIYAEDETGQVICEIDFPRTAESVSTITHTWTDESLRGQGIARELVNMAVSEIEKKGNKVDTTCSYARRVLKMDEN